MLEFTPYSWRGKQYKDIRNLMRAVSKAHPNAGVGISFSSDFMHVRNTRTNEVTSYAVERGSVNAIASEPVEKAGVQ